MTDVPPPLPPRLGAGLQAERRSAASDHLHMTLPGSSSGSDVDDMESDGGYTVATKRRLKRKLPRTSSDQAGYTCDASFGGVGPTVEFIDTAHRWFVLMDVSNCTRDIQQNNGDSKQFESASDERLLWLETSFLDYLVGLKSQCLAKNFLTKETYEGLRWFPIEASLPGDAADSSGERAARASSVLVISFGSSSKGKLDRVRTFAES
ncbi:hypothetical protein HPB49_021871 [Dermacentor silvarum]|uniref:Uncharacterized protein n=1 Tax=Dermacentor silvarum TaxID=543639 RepID=A0ACB8D009_DERSI|nr:hypothetical protein HPB49_021871 [Dermacentor silvarum]